MINLIASLKVIDSDVMINTMIEIDYRQLNTDTLESLLTEIVLREGTDYGETEYTTEEKKSQLKSALISGKAVIIFDASNNHCDIVPIK